MPRLLEDYVPVVKEAGLNTDKAVDLSGVTIDTSGNMVVPGTIAVTGAATFTGATKGPRAVAAEATAAKAVAASESGTMFVNTQGAATTTFTLPSAAAGLWYSFVESNAAGELLITPAAGDAIVTKIHAAQDGTALAPAAGTGIKNTAATNVAGDSITLVCLDATTWFGVALIGLWASQ